MEINQVIINISARHVHLKREHLDILFGEGYQIANRHIHFATEEAEEMGLKNGDIVSVEVKSEKSATLHDVHCRVSDKYRLEMHIDTDDANALLLSGGEIGTIIKE